MNGTIPYHSRFASCVLALMVSVGIAPGQTSSQDERTKVYEWGRVTLRENATTVMTRITIDALPSSRPKQYGIEPSTERISPVKPELPAYRFWVVLPPHATIRTLAQKTESSPIRPEKIWIPTGYSQSTDSSLFTPVYSTMAQVNAQGEDQPLHVEGYDWYRGYTLARIRVSPLVGSGGSTVEVHSIDATFAVQADSGPRLASSNDPQFASVFKNLVVNSEMLSSAGQSQLEWVDSTGSWIDYGRDYIKLAVGEDGVYRMYGADLKSLVPEIATIDPSTYRLISRGTEVALRVEAGNDGKLDDSDFVEFPGLRNYGSADYRNIPAPDEENPLFLNRYTDSSYYWLTWGGTSGLRVNPRQFADGATDTIRWYTEIVHLERNTMLQLIGTDLLAHQDPRWLAGDIWCWDFLDLGNPFQVSFAATNPTNDFPTARLYARYASWAGQFSVVPAHRLALAFNGSGPVKTDSLNAYQQGLMSATVSSSAVVSGTNTIVLQSLATESSLNRLIVDWFDVEYPRLLRPDSDTLIFAFHDLPDRRFRVIELQGFTSPDVVVYKYSQGFVRQLPAVIPQSGTYTIRIADTVGNGDRYMAFAAAKTKKPVVMSRKRFVNLRDQQRGADHVMITHQQWNSVAPQYESFIGTNYGVRTAVIDVEDVFDEFGYGYPIPESIREFLKATTLWQAPMPSYVLFAGDGNYDFKNYVLTNPALREKNILPPLGYPVSDPSFASFGTLPTPQMYVGRIPVSSMEEFSQYFDHVRAYLGEKNDDWNKRYILFAGGDPRLPGEIESFKQVHQQIASTIIQPPPIGGATTLFYKTASPPSDFGPFTKSHVDSVMMTGALCINYIGHSGTQTWDNGIGDPSQLTNGRGKYSLVLDFGCSTAKFAEPNIKAFGELFTVGSKSSAIAFIGNSALGYTSVALTLPQLFFQTLLKDSAVSIGQAHLIAKIKRVNSFGGYIGGVDDLNKIMMLTNALLGDPIVRIAVPQKPNLQIYQSDFGSSGLSSNDDEDFVNLKFPYWNTGSVTADTFGITVHSVYSQTSNDTTLRRALPAFQDTLMLRYAVKDRPGQHSVSVTLNPAKTLSELDYSANVATYPLLVLSNALKPVQPQSMYESPNRELILLNPQRQVAGGAPNVILEVDTGSGYGFPLRLTQPLQGIQTTFGLSGLQRDRNYSWRAEVENSNRPWTEGVLAFTSQLNYRWHPRDSSAWVSHSFVNTVYSVAGGVALGGKITNLRSASGGYDDGRTAVIAIDGINIVANGLDRGHHMAALDSSFLEILSIATFDPYGFPDQADSMVAFIQSFPAGTIIMDAVSDEGSGNLSAAARQALGSIGSTMGDSIAFRDSYAIVGRKGALPGTVPELWLPRFSGKLADVETTFARTQVAGLLASPVIGPAGSWIGADVQGTTPAGGSLTVDVVGVRSNGIRDTLFSHQAATTIPLASINAGTHPYLQLVGNLKVNSLQQSPALTDWNVSFVQSPELALNYQSVTLSADSVLEGTPVDIQASVYNVGTVAADSVFVRLTTLSSGGLQVLDSVLINSIPSDGSKTVSFVYPTTGRRGLNTLFVEVDPQQRIAELYKSNNVYSMSVFAKTDTVPPSFEITFDGNRIVDGDFVSPTPEIRIVAFDNSPLPITDPANVALMLDNRRVTLGNYPDSLFEQGTAPEKIRVTFRPKFSSGPHQLSVKVRDASADTTAQQIQFKVENQPKLLDVFNFPNPFANETYFTFALAASRVPDVLSIKVYTVAGRLTRDIKVYQPDLRIGFNRIYWDGRDEDGNELANGVYFYKVLFSVDDQSQEVIQKLAKVK
ncbi:MAG: C25 family cysteine peptidase [Bacteroidota bacterium]